jgi:hypothetical protein
VGVTIRRLADARKGGKSGQSGLSGRGGPSGTPYFATSFRLPTSPRRLGSERLRRVRGEWLRRVARGYGEQATNGRALARPTVRQAANENLTQSRKGAKVKTKEVDSESSLLMTVSVKAG